MQAILIFGGIALGLFILAFLSKRRFGVLGLALAAGAVIGEVWAYEINLFAGIFRFGSDEVGSFVVSSLALLLPALLIMMRGSSYKNWLARLFGALFFAILALAFLAEPMMAILSMDGSMREAYLRLVNQKDLVIGAGLILATLEVFFTKHSSKGKEKRAEH